MQVRVSAGMAARGQPGSGFQVALCSEASYTLLALVFGLSRVSFTHAFPHTSLVGVSKNVKVLREF